MPTQNESPKLCKSCIVKATSPSSGGLGGRSKIPLNSSTRGARVTVAGKAAQSITMVATRFALVGRERRGLVRVCGRPGTFLNMKLLCCLADPDDQDNIDFAS